MTTPKLKKFVQITGKIVVETGLRIGGSQETMEISGLDNPILRNPTNSEPYIPGSSLKGKLRSLCEWYFGELPENGDVTKPILTSRTGKVFGIPAKDPRNEKNPEITKAISSGPTRLIVRDAPLTDASREQFESGIPITEVKSENSINRLTSMANPRPMERVLPGVSFELNMSYRVFDLGDDGQEDEKNLKEVLCVGLALLQADALGGGASRGNGKIRIEDLARDGEPLALPELSFVLPTA